MTVSHHGTARSNTARLSTETKSALKTTELIAYIVAVIAVLIATQVSDGLGADKGWLYVTVLTVGYLLSRGLAKSGSRDFYDTDRHDNDGYGNVAR